MAERIMEVLESSALMQWSWAEMGWIHLTRGEFTMLATLIGAGIIMESVNHLRGRGSLFF